MSPDRITESSAHPSLIVVGQATKAKLLGTDDVNTLCSVQGDHQRGSILIKVRSHLA